MPLKSIKKYFPFSFLMAVIIVAHASTEETITAIAQQSINCVFNHNEATNKACLKEVNFSPEVANSIEQYYKDNENFQIMLNNTMIMREKQESTHVKQIDTHDKSSNTNWMATTRFTLYLVKDNIEIQRPMENTQIISLALQNSPTWTVKDFTTNVIGDSLIIDHELMRKKNCQQDDNFQEN